MRTTATPLHHQPSAREQIGRCARGRPLPHLVIPSGKNTQKFSCSPEWMLTPELAYELRELGIDAMRTVVRRSAPITKPAFSFLFETREPLVADATTDTISGAELGHREPVAQSIANELNSLFHR